MMFDGQDTHCLVIEKSPWYKVFSRHPVLAFLAGSVPLGLIAAVIWFVMASFRRKNRTIRRHRDRLDQALTELKEAQQKLIAAEKYKQAKDIAVGVAHEIHNALYPAINALTLLRQRIERNDVAFPKGTTELFDLINQAVARGMRMTELVKTYSRLESEKALQAVNLKQAAEEAATLCRPRLERLGVRLELSIPGDHKVKCCRDHLVSILSNLIANALDALEDAETRRISIASLREGDFLRIEVMDTGEGMSEEVLRRAFDAFFSTRPGTGTGLGLSIVKKLVELYGGRVTADSSLDKWTRFTILLASA